MAVNFGTERWDEVKANAARWWAGDLKRPLIHLTTWGQDPGRAEPALPGRGFAAHYGWDVTPEAIVDRWDYDLSKQVFLGDAFPSVWPNFGPGTAAAFLGCNLESDARTVWFNAPQVLPLRDLQLRFDPRNRWLRRVQDVMAAAAERWRGQVQVGMTDLGGNLDILASFRTSENLLLDLYDDPEELQRLIWQSHAMWWLCFDELDRAHRLVNPGYTAWTPVYSAEPYYMLQCDFAYMIGPAMFDQFVKPELAATCRRLTHAFYHLDGIGQLPHLDALLSIPELRGIQWIPGDGQPDITHWPEVYRRIRAVGKRIQIFTHQAKELGWRALDVLAEQLGSAEGIVMIGACDPRERAEVDAFLKRHAL